MLEKRELPNFHFCVVFGLDFFKRRNARKKIKVLSKTLHKKILLGKSKSEISHLLPWIKNHLEAIENGKKKALLPITAGSF